MDLQSLTYLFVGISFTLYIGIAIWSRARSTNDFYIAGKGVNPVANGMATAADWMSAASFISMAGLIAFLGKDGSVYLMGWTGGYVLLALLLAPYLRKFGQYTYFLYYTQILLHLTYTKVVLKPCEWTGIYFFYQFNLYKSCIETSIFVSNF
jgi:Na+(H+)/acetate symporter ActP